MSCSCAWPVPPMRTSFTGLAGRLAGVSELPWLPVSATGKFATEGCHHAASAIGQPGQLVLIAADSDDDRIGFVHALLDTSAFTGEKVGYASTLVVTAAAAGAGVGRALMTAAEDWARDQACALTTLEVFASNAAARAVCARLGYAEQTLKLANALIRPGPVRRPPTNRPCAEMPPSRRCRPARRSPGSGLRFQHHRTGARSCSVSDEPSPAWEGGDGAGPSPPAVACPVSADFHAQ